MPETPALPAAELKPTEVLEPVLAASIEEGDRIAVVLRSILGGLTLLRVAGSHPDRLLAGDPRYLVVCSTLLAGLLLPPLAARYLRGRLAVRARATLSVGADALIVALALAPSVVWPHADYRGFLREPDLGFFCLAIAGAGLRLERRVVVAGLFANTACVVGLLVADLALAPRSIGYEATDVVLVAILLGGAGGLAVILAGRTRRLLFDGSRATLLAERARQRLGIYVSEEVASQALQPGRLELGGTRREVAVLFSDLRGFTRYSETLAPEGLVGELNDYFEAMVREIRAEGGIVDKYIGDAVMAVFGLTGGGDAAGRALRAAAAMQRALAAHNALRQARGRPPLAHGIGVHYGPVVAGNIGTNERMQYTVIGDVVNLASRLESATKELGAPVVASAEAVQAASRGSANVPRTELRGSIEVRGRAAKVEVHAVLTAAEDGTGAGAAGAT